MKKFAVGFFLLLITLIIGVFSFNLLEKPTDIFISQSGKYKVELYGDKRRPWFFTNTVRAKIYSDNKLLGLEGVHYADWLDVSFEEAFKFIDWQNNNVSRFGYEEISPQKDADTLTIYNKSKKNLQYLFVRCFRDKYLIFDLKAGESQVLNKSQSAEIADYYILTKLENGEKIELGASFKNQKKSFAEKPLQFCISVEEVNANSVNNSVKITDCSS